MHDRRPFAIAATLAPALVVGVIVYGWNHGPAAAVDSTPRPSSASVASTAPELAAPPSLRATGMAEPPGPRAADPYESLAQKVDRLSRSADPVDAFAAYQLVTACIWARDHEGWMARHILPVDRGMLPTTQQACGDIASDQIQSRLRWLERAALGGVHHAATEMLEEGPDGLGVSASSDIDAPENAPWKQRVDSAVDAGVHTCDADSLERRVDRYANGEGVEQDRAKALTYWVAYMACRQRLANTSAPVLGNADSVTQRMGTTLDADQIAKAVSAGQQLARDAQPLPNDR